MKSSNKHIDQIEEALIAAHRRQEDPPLPPDWRQQVMQDIKSLTKPAAFPQEKKLKTILPKRMGAWAALSLAVVVGWLILTNLDWEDPWLSLKHEVAALESHHAFWLAAGDAHSGLRSLTVTVIQEEIRIEVLSKNFEEPEKAWFSKDAVVNEIKIPLVIDTQALGLQEGEATIVVTARDLSWSNGFKGRQTTLKKKIVVYHQSP